MSANDWFKHAFGRHYLDLYAHRDDSEAQGTVDLILRVVPLPAGARVLDAPCGAGRHARELLQRGLRVTALDLSRHLLDNARQQSDHGFPDYVRGDIRALPFAPASFDLVANLFSSFGYFDSDDDNLSVLAEFQRVLRPGGWLVLDFMNEPYVRATLRGNTTRTTDQGWIVSESRTIQGSPPRVEKRTTLHIGSETHSYLESVRLFSPAELAEALTGAGLTVMHKFGDYLGEPLVPEGPRAILFAQKSQ